MESGFGRLTFTLTHKAEQGRPVVRLVEPMRCPDGVEVPKDFETDFFSIPGFIQWLFQVFGRGCQAAIRHDLDCNRGVARPIRSARLYHGCVLLGVAHWKAATIFLVVRYWPGSEWDMGVARRRA